MRIATDRTNYPDIIRLVSVQSVKFVAFCIPLVVGLCAIAYDAAYKIPGLYQFGVPHLKLEASFVSPLPL